MHKLASRLMGAGLILGLGSTLGLWVGAMPATAQESGIANTAEDFKSADSDDGLFGSDIDVFELMHRVSAGSGAVVDDGFYRSQGRRIDREANSLRARQRAILEQQTVDQNQSTIPLDFFQPE
ncbi:MAG: hypothetical protein AAF703_20435 [Cyanobacteria bacterium P01_D01_bin.105]